MIAPLGLRQHGDSGVIMKKIFAAAIGLASLIAAPAMAADIAVKAPRYKAPPLPVRVFSWTGCYIGGNVGGVWAHKEWSSAEPGLGGGIPLGTSFGSHDPSGFIGGFQAGCDYQFAGNWVVGIAGDYDWADAKASNANLIAPNMTDQSRVKGLASITGRVGYAWDRFLGYVKGGGAWERDDYTLYNVGIVQASASETRGGWTVGIGGEYAFTDWLSGFAEYNYYNFGTRTNSLVCGVGACFGGGLAAARFDIKETKSVFKVGLNARWGGGPVVAKY
jgi:outer membrane immunogenic protein